MNLSPIQPLASKVSDFLRWWRRADRLVTVVMFHSVSPQGGPWTSSPTAFKRQIRFLVENYQVIPLRQIAETLLDTGSQRRVVITFDDAYRDFVEYAYPLLEDFGVPCTLFVPVAYIGKCNDWDVRTEGYRKMRIMEADQLRQLANSPRVDIGSHTVDHFRMSHLPLREMQRQASASRAMLEQLIGRAVVLFSYPWGQLGDFSKLSEKVLAEASYTAAVTSRWGSTNSIKQLFALRRISFEDTDSIADLRAKVEGEYDWYAVKEWLGYVRRHLAASRRKTESRYSNSFQAKPDLRGLRP